MTEFSNAVPTLDDVRNNIDSIDREIVKQLAKRQKWVLAAGKLKKNEESVRAPARVELVISKVRALAEEAGASPDVVESTYRAIIAEFINLELAQHRLT